MAALVVRAEAHRVLNDCPSTAIISRAFAKIPLPAETKGEIGTLSKDDCQVQLRAEEMSIDLDDLSSHLVAAGRGLATGIWSQIETFAVPELKKIAVQIEALADPASPWSFDQKKLLLEMQVDAAASVIVAMTSLVLLDAQNALNAILDAVKDFVNGAIGIALV